MIDISTGSLKPALKCARCNEAGAEYLCRKKCGSISFTALGKEIQLAGEDNRRLSVPRNSISLVWLCITGKKLKLPFWFNKHRGCIGERGDSPVMQVIVADMYANSNGRKIYLLVQGYQPAQEDIQLSPQDFQYSPWYKAVGEERVLIQNARWEIYKGAVEKDGKQILPCWSFLDCIFCLSKIFIHKIYEICWDACYCCTSNTDQRCHSSSLRGNGKLCGRCQFKMEGKGCEGRPLSMAKRLFRGWNC